MRDPFLKGIFSKSLVITVFSLFLITQISSATHLRAGEITVVRDNCASLTFKITITVYIDTESGVKFGDPSDSGQDVLDFGDGEQYFVRERPTEPRPDLGVNMGIASIELTHTYRGPGTYKISYREPMRNEKILNMVNSGNNHFYLETEIIIDPFLGCNNSPQLKIPPVDRGCIGVAFQHNPGAFDPDPKDSLSYQLVEPFRDRNQVVTGYKDPTDVSFYTGLNYNQANEAKTDKPVFRIDPVTGTLTWDAPGAQGEYNVAFHIIEWRKVKGEWRRLGHVRRDMQIDIKDCNNKRPDLKVPADTCVVAGTTLNSVIEGFDPDRDNVKIEIFSEILGPAFLNSVSVSPSPPIFQSTHPQPAKLTFEWRTACDYVRERSYQIVFKITDNGRPNLVTFKTWFVTVVGPPPIWNTATVDLAKRHVNLSWQQYTCDNAETIQVWRKVDSTPYMPGACETGMPPSLGYELIDEVPAATVNTYKDTNKGKGLSVGAEYCYRLVAIFPLPKGGQSIMSDEICVPPILVDAPVITHVTVQKTDRTNGEIRVSWRSPFEIDKTDFPPPYKYKVLRSESFTGASPLTAIHTGIIDDTTIVDNTINTLEKTYSYIIELHSKTATNVNYEPVDSSASASMVLLQVQSQQRRLDLSWTAFVPWSNQVQAYPYHRIYRGLEGTPEANLELIDSVNVTLNPFIYLDSGQYNNTKLEDDQVYCYKILTRGSYGNPAIDEPQENFSQRICARLSNTNPVNCVPTVTLANIRSCEEYLADEKTCGISSFANEITWNRISPQNCEGINIVGYRVYASQDRSGQFFQISKEPYIRDTFFVDANLTSRARCYKVSAIDESGNESQLSELVCNDNCPYYELPNVFTPNNDKCNDLFSAYSDRDVVGEDPDSGQRLCHLFDKSKCARFVQRVEFTVYNRWGIALYNFESVKGDNREKSIYIDWDGRDNNGTIVASGVYYYVADVTFKTLDESKRNQTIKGWVHLVR
jgi:hypothetical protein